MSAHSSLSGGSIHRLKPSTSSAQVCWPARADLDNLMGAILDCGNQLVWRDDRVSVISKIVGEHKKAKEKDSTIEIRIWYLP